MSLTAIKSKLKSLANPKRALFSINYFPPQPGQKLDKFYGSSVPETRSVAKEFRGVDFSVIQKLIDSDYHEEKLCGLMILAWKLGPAIKKQDSLLVKEIKDFYVKNVDVVNHWDLVDESANTLLGECLVYGFLEQKRLENFQKLTDFQDKANGFPTLDILANSDNIWHKRISIISQFSWLKRKNIKHPLSLCQFHIDHKHHYIQKAVGWILREVGKQDKDMLNDFLTKNIDKINSICLSYALEKHTKEEKVFIRSLRKSIKQR